MRGSVIFRIVCFSFVAGVGVYVCAYRGSEPLFLFSAALGLCAAGIFFRRCQAVCIPAVVLAAFLFGMARMAASGAVVQSEVSNSRATSVEVDMRGVVSAEPIVTQSRQILPLRVQYISGTDTEYMKGHVRVFAPLMPSYQYGDELQVRCELLPDRDPHARVTRPPICVESEIQRVARGKGNGVFALILRVKESFLGAIKAHLSEPHASLLGALLVGERSGFPSWLTDAFVRSGILHIVAISGYNITIIIAGMYALFRACLLGRKQSFWYVVCGIIFFVLLTGSSASVVRAALMGIAVLFAQHIGRRSHAGNIILLAATGMIAYQPAILFDVGFLLSFAATCGLVYISPIFERACEKMPQYFGMKTIALQTLSATLCTAPILLFSFQRFSVVSVGVNMLVLPLIPVVMAVGFFWAGVAFFGQVLGDIIALPFGALIQIASWPVWFLLSYIIVIAEKFSHIPWASLDVRLGTWAWVFAYVSYMLIIWLVWAHGVILKKKGSMVQCEDIRKEI